MQDNKRFISPSLFAIIIICLFMPFVVVSCGGQTASISGFQMVTGVSFGFGQSVEPNPLAMLVFVAAIAGIAFGLSKNKNSILSIVAGIVGFVGVFILKLGIDSNLSGSGSMVSVSYGMGFYLPLLLFAGAAAYNFYEMNEAKKGFSTYNPSSSFGARAPSPPPQSYAPLSQTSSKQRFCMHCGAKTSEGDVFCSECGANIK